MINKTGSLVFLKVGRELALLFDKCLSKAIEICVNCTAPSVKRRTSFKTAAEDMKCCLGKGRNVEEVMELWLLFCSRVAEKEDMKFPVIEGFEVSNRLAGIGHIRAQRVLLKLLFILMHKYKAVLLPVEFSPPLAGWLEDYAANGGLYSPLIERFQLLRSQTLNYQHRSDSLKNSNNRLFQTGRRLILASAWYSPECINCEDLDEWVIFQAVKHKETGSARLPVQAILNSLVEFFPNGISEDVKNWKNSDQLLLRERLRTNDLINIVESAIIECKDPLSVVRKIVSNNKISDSLFFFNNISAFSIDNISGLVNPAIDVALAIKRWAEAFDFFLLHKGLENSKAYQTTFGRLNLYLFIYLPLWMKANPATSFLYPSAPNLFRGFVHYRCELRGNESRALSLIEFYDAMGWPKSYAMLNPLRVFFKVMIALPMMPGCDGIVQPIYWLPKSKSYSRVVKQIFPGEQLLLFVDFLFAIESVSDWAAMNEVAFRKEFECAKKENRLFSFSNVGYIPVLLVDDRFRPVECVHPIMFIFFDHGGRSYFNPGATRFSIFMLEVGVRAQTAQWLCSTTYNLVAYMGSKHPLQLVSLWLNTDKISKVPLVVITVMQMLWLLDAQVEWRDNLKCLGVSGFGKKVFYERNHKSKWGLISPIFAHDPRTGAPFSDYTYYEFWAYQCFSFQSWVRGLGVTMPNIVAYLPLKKNGGFFTWDEFLLGVSDSDVKVKKGAANAKIYAGDYCPISFRCKVTPHGARASFVTSMSVALCPEAMVLLTGQTAGTVRKYNKGDYLLRRKIQGAFNGKDMLGALAGGTKNISLGKMMDDICKELLSNEPLDLQYYGLLSPSFSYLDGGKSFAPDIIASDAKSNIKSCFSHICTKGFICPSEILKAFSGTKICPACPYALFSIFHLPEVSAARQKAVEDFSNLSDALEKRRMKSGFTTEDLDALILHLNQQAKLAVAWLALEESLWAQIQIIRRDTEKQSDLIAIDRRIALEQIERYEVAVDSAEFFFSRLAEVCMYEDSSSVEFQYKIEKATRLLLVQDKKLLEAALMPAQFSTATRLASMLRARIGFTEFDVEEFVSLINMGQDEWRLHFAVSHEGNIEIINEIEME